MTFFTLRELAEKIEARLVGDPHHSIKGVAELELATPEEASFLANPLYHSLLDKTQAGVICIDVKTSPPEGKNLFLSSNPSQTFQRLVELFSFPDKRKSGFEGIHPSAIIHPTVQLGRDVEIGPYTVIDQGCVIGEQTHIGAGVFIGPHVKIGSHCFFHPNVVVRELCEIGHRVILQPGAVIGSCGYGYHTTAQGEHVKQEQVGIVVLEDDVEIGANTTIDRARFKETRICRGTKIDNLVQIGHNVLIGAHNLIVSQTGIAGSVTTGDHVVMGGQTGVVGHLKIASGAMFAARSGLRQSVKEKGQYGGDPVVPLKEYLRGVVLLKKIIGQGKLE